MARMAKMAKVLPLMPLLPQKKNQYIRTVLASERSL
jgi:hypothetical protein